MKQIQRKIIETFLRQEGYEENSSELYSEEERKVFDCWSKGGKPKVRLRIGKNIFQSSEFFGIFQDAHLLKKFQQSIR